MKNTLLILFCFSMMLNAQNWVWQNPLPQGKNINWSQAVSSNIVYACGDDGLLLKTTNGGETWDLLQQFTMKDFNSLYFTDEQNGIIVGSNGIIVNTTNGGINFSILDDNKSYDLYSVVVLNETIIIAGSHGVLLRSSDSGNEWNVVPTGNTKSISELFFITTSKGWMVGEDGLIRTTTDAGITWIEQQSQLNSLLSTVYFQNEEVGYAAGIEGKVIKTIDGGNNWYPLNTGVNNWIKSIRFFDENIGTATGSPGIILQTTDGGETWHTQNNMEAFSFANIALAIDSSSWLVGQRGVILKTTNKSNEWEFQSSGSLSNLNDICFISADSGYAVGDRGTLLQTIDGGDTWNIIPLGNIANYNCIYFLNKNEGWIVGDSSIILSTTNAGNTWVRDTLVESIPSYSLTDFSAIPKTTQFNPATKFIVGQRGMILIGQTDSETGKLLWRRDYSGLTVNRINKIAVFESNVFLIAGEMGALFFQIPPPNTAKNLSIPSHYDLMDLSVINKQTVWAVGSYGLVLKAKRRTDFSVLTHLNVNRLNSVHFLDNFNGFTAGTAGSVFRTSDGGLNWTRMHTGITNEIKKIHFINQNTGYLVGINGLILKLESASGVLTEIEDDNELIIPDKYILRQNYPNPFNPSTIIRYQIHDAGFVTLKVFDVLGNEIATLVDEYKDAEIYEVEFDATNLASGIYFYQLNVGGLTSTKKMILLR